MALDLFGFLSVLLHGLSLTAQALTLGGLGFLLCLGVPLAGRLGPEGPELLRRAQGLTAWSALGLALAAGLTVALKTMVLMQSMELGLAQALGAQFAVAGGITALAALAVASLSRTRLAFGTTLLLAVLGMVILGAATASTHAVARMEDRVPMAIVSALHQGGAGLWIGGMPYLLLALAHCREGEAARLIGRRFSQLSMLGVGLIGGAGLLMAYVYIGTLEALYGTAYGVMTATKAAIFLALLGLGWANYRLVERLRRDAATPLLRLRRFAEVELGVGITVFFAAASLTSLPPAVDLSRDRVTLTQIVERVLTPRLPSLTSPEHADLAIPALQARLDEAAAAARAQAPQAFVPGAGVLPPRNAQDIAWSEYNHHWAGIFVLLIGLLALAERTGWAPWARHWPLVFLALAGFLLVRSDPETWPLGDIGFFESLRDPEVVQHRIVVLLVGVFGLFEWRVRAGRLRPSHAAYVFPLGNAIGGGLLLAHSHALANIQDQLLIELTHTPLALTGMTAGWARWLELRAGPPVQAIAAWVWPVCFALVGLMLLSYRES